MGSIGISQQSPSYFQFFSTIFAKVPIQRPGGVTTFKIYDIDNCFFGFDDGFIYGLYKGKEIFFKPHCFKITDIHFFQNLIFTSSLDGSINVLDPQRFTSQRSSTDKDLPILKFHVTEGYGYYSFKIITNNGNIL